jgi:hypothetical protein
MASSMMGVTNLILVKVKKKLACIFLFRVICYDK